MLAVVVAELLQGGLALSVTVSVTVKLPAAAYGWTGIGPVASTVMPLEASKSQAYVRGSPSGSAEAVPSKLIGTPAIPE